MCPTPPLPAIAPTQPGGATLLKKKLAPIERHTPHRLAEGTEATHLSHQQFGFQVKGSGVPEHQTSELTSVKHPVIPFQLPSVHRGGVRYKKYLVVQRDWLGCLRGAGPRWLPTCIFRGPTSAASRCRSAMVRSFASHVPWGEWWTKEGGGGTNPQNPIDVTTTAS